MANPLPSLSESKVVFMDEDADRYRVLGRLFTRSVTGTWRPLNEWLYLSEEDPYCYIELIYDNWWWEKSNPRQHCVTELKKLGCSLISMHEHPQEWKVLQFKNNEDCVGIKGSKRQVTHGLIGWKRVYEFSPNVISWRSEDHLPTTIHGKLYAVLDDGYAKAVSPLYKRFGMWFGGGFNNAILQNGTRPWIHPHWLITAKALSLEDLARASMWIIDTKSSTSVVYPSLGTCNTILTDGLNFTLRGIRMRTLRTYKPGYVQMTCGMKICDCPSVPLHSLQDLRPETELIVNNDRGFFSGLIEWLEGIFFSAMNYILSALAGDQWQVKLLIWAAVYFVTSQISRSVGAGIVIAALVAYNSLNH